MHKNIAIQSHDIHKKNFTVSSEHASADAFKVLASLEIMKDLADTTKFMIDDPDIRHYLQDMNFVHENKDCSFSCSKEERISCTEASNTIAKYVDETIRVFHEDYPNGTLCEG